MAPFNQCRNVLPEIIKHERAEGTQALDRVGQLLVESRRGEGRAGGHTRAHGAHPRAHFFLFFYQGHVGLTESPSWGRRKKQLCGRARTGVRTGYSWRSRPDLTVHGANSQPPAVLQAARVWCVCVRVRCAKAEGWRVGRGLANTMCDSLVATVRVMNATIAALEAQLAAAGPTAPDPDPCANTLEGTYSFPMHIGSAFIILLSSCLGVASVLLGKRHAALRMPPLCIALGKTFGTGIVLACALVHMLQPSVVSLTGPCVPASISTDYPAYSYLIAMLAAVAVQTIEMLAKDFQLSAKPVAIVCTAEDCEHENLAASDPKQSAHDKRVASAFPAEVRQLEALPQAGGEGGSASSSSPGSDQSFSSAPPGQPHAHKSPPQHSILSLLAAEFGFTLHSLFIGLAVGVVADADLNALLVALAFHQFFEGVALGARLADSPLSFSQDNALALIFSVSAPIGIGCGVGLMSSGGINTNGQTFSMVQGIFDAICAGILLHIGFNLTINEFPKDVARLKEDRKHSSLHCTLMYLALWGGGGIMAFFGKYL